MKRTLLFLLLLEVACGKESSVAPASAPTFVHYFNGGNNDVAQSVVETSKGDLLILATTQISPTHTKIKLIRTDAYGNERWQKFYPPFDSVSEGSYTAGGIFVLPGDSILITGGRVDVGIDTSRLLLLKTDDQGVVGAKLTMKYSSAIAGTAVTPGVSGDYLVLGLAPNDAVHNMVLVSVTGTLKAIRWSNPYGAGQVIGLSHKMYIDPTGNNAVWSGTVSRGIDAVRLVEMVANSQNPGAVVADVSPSSPTVAETANDFTKVGQAYAFIGEKADSILFRMVRLDGPTLTVISEKGYAQPTGYSQPSPYIGYNGNSICATRDGGLLLLGTVHSPKSLGDYYLMKIDAFGTPAFPPRIYGGQFDDAGVQVIQASDGGYVVLGTTTLANVKTIMLMKTDMSGEIR